MIYNHSTYLIKLIFLFVLGTFWENYNIFGFYDFWLQYLKAYVLKNILHCFPVSVIKQAEKLKSCEMKEGWMKNDECWRMNDEGWRFQVVEGFCDWRTDERTNERTFVNVESLSQLKETSVIYKLLQCKYLSVHVYILNIIWVYTLSCILYSIHFILLLSKVLAFLSKWSPSIYIFKYFNIS